MAKELEIHLHTGEAHSIAILHLLGHKQIRINTNIRLHGKYSSKYNVCVCVCGGRRLCDRLFSLFLAFSGGKKKDHTQ